jgi:two-component system sensor histidine kinase/response regulator
MLEKLDHDDPLLGRIVVLSATLMGLAGGTMAVLIGLTSPSASPRVWLDASLVIVALLSLALHRKGKTRFAIRVIIVSYFIVVTDVSLINGGLRAPSIINYPLIVIVAGWLVGTWAVLVMALLSEFAFLAFLYGELIGMIPPPDYANSAVQMVFCSAILAVATGVALFSRRGYLTRVVEAKSAAERLALSEAEVRRHRDELEQLVAERTQDLQEARAEAERLMHVKGDFLANMSHEIRTPMNAILGFAALLRKEATAPQQIDRLDNIHTAGEHLLCIINDILDLSKIEAGKLDLERIDFRVDTVLLQVKSLLAEAARTKGLNIDVEYGDVPIWLKGDPTRLRQALLNFAGNAVKFTERGSVSLRARLVEDLGDEILVRFEVQDMGIGIAAEKLAGLFQAFEQVDSSTTRKYGGTGLGLAITKRLAILMGGTAGAESTLGVGSTFWVTARLGRGQASEQTDAEAGREDAEAILSTARVGARVMLADDDPVNQEIALAMLEDTGLVIDSAKDGREAVTKAAETAYDLILMDMQMPVMDGLTATRAIRALKRHAETPVLAMTASVCEEERGRCIAAGMNDFIPKPVRPDQLFSTLAKWLPRSVPSRPATVSERPVRQDPSATLERLAAIPGLDPNFGLESVVGKADAYMRLLRKYSENRKQDMVAIRTSLETDDLAEAYRLTHSLKGASAILGLLGIQMTAAELEDAIQGRRSSAALRKLAAELEAELATVSAAIQAALDL